MGDRIVDLLIKGMERLGAVFGALRKRCKRQAGAMARRDSCAGHWQL